MQSLGELYQTADWKTEKHVPVIECADQVKAGEAFPVTLTVGKEVPHPNTTEHHIRWIKLYFYPNGAKFPYEVGSFEFTVHGESATGANQGPAYIQPQVTAWVKVSQPGTLLAASYCNIHGLWQSDKAVGIVTVTGPRAVERRTMAE